MEGEATRPLSRSADDMVAGSEAQTVRVDRPEGLSDRGDPGEIRAAIDLGTNSFHLLVARLDADGQFDVLAREKEVVRLGSGSGDMTQLDAEAMNRGIEALVRFGKIAETYGAHVDAVATSALREATNRNTFLERARSEAGIEVDVISGVEEARLIHLGVLQSVPLFDERICVVDIGGGSTEFLVGEGTKVLAARSTKLGAIRLTDRFFPDGRIRGKAVKECRDYLRSFLVSVFSEVGDLAPFCVVGSSGTISNLARMIHTKRGGDPMTPLNATTFTRKELQAVVAELISRKRPEDRADLGGLDERRRDIIVAGALLLDEIMEGLKADELMVSDAALREGILLDRASASTEPAFHHLSNIRRESVLRMAEQYHEDLAHISKATDLALELFDGLADRHGLGLLERDYLEAAGLLHNVGLFVAHAAHHKHSYYVIRNSDQLAGFTDREIEVIAQVARYHRKSAPKASHDQFQRLGQQDQSIVRLLAGLLRVGIALDRTRCGLVAGLLTDAVYEEGDKRNLHDAVGADGGTGASRVTVLVRCVDNQDPLLELYTADQRKELLEEALGCEVEMQFVSQQPVK